MPVDKNKGKMQESAEHYHDLLHTPCKDCHPLYRVGYVALEEAIADENFGDAYRLGATLYYMVETNEGTEYLVW